MSLLRTTNHPLHRPMSFHDRRRRLLWGLLLLGLCTLALFSPQAVRSAPSVEGAPGGTIVRGPIFLPLIQNDVTPSPRYDVIPIIGPPVDRDPVINGDLNLALRGYVTSTATLELVNLSGETDVDPPQLAGIFNHQRMPTLVGAYQVRDWDWSCGLNGCPAAPITTPPVTLLALAAEPGEAIYIPTRGSEIYAGGYKVLVLYATPTRITLTYTRDDTPAVGYVVHLEQIEVEGSLVELYTQQHAAGRSRLPGLRNGERLGRATAAPVLVAIRDTGSFMEPRSRKDWWQGYLGSE